MKGWIDPH